MKKTLLFFALCVTSLVGFAQKDSKSLGAHLSLGTEGNQLGFGIKSDYFLTDNFRLEGVFDNYFKKNGVGMWDLAANIQYVIHLGERHAIYPVVGFTMTDWYATVETTKGEKIYVETDHRLRFGSNFGAGFEYGLTNNLRAYVEAKDQVVSDYSQWVFNLGLKYRF